MNQKKKTKIAKSIEPVRDLTEAEIKEKVERLEEVFKVGMTRLPTPEEAEALLTSLALIRGDGSQKDAGGKIHVSPRMVNYKVDIYDLRPLIKAIQAGRVKLNVKPAVASVVSEVAASASLEEVIHGSGFAATAAK